MPPLAESWHDASMNVLYLTNNAGHASTTVSTQGWFRLLAPSGLRPVLASPRTGAFAEWATQRGIPFYRLPLPFPSKSRPWGFLNSLWRLWRIAKRHKIELVHCNEQDVYPIGQYLARLCRVPVVVSVHSRMQPGFSRWAFRGARQPRRVFFISRGNLEVCRSGMDGVVPETRWRLLYNGIDTRHYRPDQSLRQAFRGRHGLDSELLIGIACALRPGKQLEHFFQAAAGLSSPRTRVVLAGGPVPGSETYAENVINVGRQLLQDSLIHLGHLSDLRGFYNALDLAVNTSEGEACSISILEALACGCPVLGYPSISVHEQVLPDGGEIVAQDDIGALRAALKQWLGDPAELSRMRPGARKRVETDFDIEKIAAQLWSEYLDVLNCTKNSADRCGLPSVPNITAIDSR